MRRCRLCLQRVQSHAGLLPCQFRYLLPFRVQVYRLAGFRVPSHVSRQQFSSQASPFSPAGPIGLVPRLRRYYGDATPSAVYASRTASPLPMQDSLPAGWLAFAGREFNPLDQIERVQLLHLIPLSRVFLTQAGRMSCENLWMR